LLKIPDFKDLNANIKAHMLMIALLKGSNNIGFILLELVIKISREGSEKSQVFLSCILLHINIPLKEWPKPMGLQDEQLFYLNIFFC
jgi:hypothetical protein